MLKDINQGSFTGFVDAFNTLGIPVTAIIGVLALVGDQALTTESMHRAWTAYQSSPAYKSVGAQVGARQAS